MRAQKKEERLCNKAPGICRKAAISLALPLVCKHPDGYGGDADRIPLRAKRGRSPAR